MDEQPSMNDLLRALVRGERARVESDPEPNDLRSKIAREKGLPDALADRLRGGSRAEIEADADRLRAALPQAETMDQKLRRAVKEQQEQLRRQYPIGGKR